MWRGYSAAVPGGVIHDGVAGSGRRAVVAHWADMEPGKARWAGELSPYG